MRAFGGRDFSAKEGSMDLATVDKLLTTTRSVRKRLDFTRPVDPEVLQQCLEIATQAPIGGNNCRYHFVVVADPTKRAALADLYRRAMRRRFSPSQQPAREPKMWASAWYLDEHLHEVPIHTSCPVSNTHRPGRGKISARPQ
jgi:nitroreductase